MCGLCEISQITPYTYSAFFVHLVVLLTFCNTARGDIVVYDGTTDVAEFPDIELPYTQSIRRNGIEGALVAADPLHACINISRPPDVNGSMNWFVLMSGNFCTFETKVRNAKLAGYSLGIIFTYRARVENFSNLGHYRFYSGMPTVVVRTEDGLEMKENFLFDDTTRFRLVVYPNNSFSIMTFLLLFSIVAGLFLVIMLAFTVIRFFQQSNTVHNGRLSSQHLRQLQTTTYQKGDLYETCAICLEDYKDQDKLRILPCSHGYHMKCIDPWLTNNRRICPVCKRKVLMGGETSRRNLDQNFEETESTPLLQGSRVGPRSAFNYSTTTPVLGTHVNVPTDEAAADNEHSIPVAGLQSERQPGE